MKVLCLGMLTAFAVACEKAPSQNDIVFDGPTGLTVAGKGDNRYLFVANSEQDALQVLRYEAGLQSMAIVRGPGAFFALRVPTGSGPIALASSQDGGHVLVLERISARLRLVDAVSLRLSRDTDGASIALPLGGAVALPSAMVAMPGDCGTNCLGSFFVALQGLGQVVEVRLSRASDDVPPVLTPVSLHDVGGAPSHLAASADGTTLYVTDSSTSYLHALHRPSGRLTRVDLGGNGGPVAVAPAPAPEHDDVVFVARPLLRDVVAFSVADDGALTAIDANSRALPTPACVGPCGGAARCDDQHPGDSQICRDGATLSAVPDAAYRGLFVDTIPSRMAWISGASLAIPCGDAKSDIADYLLVVGASGDMRFLQVEHTQGQTPRISGISETWCDEDVLKTAGVEALEAAAIRPDGLRPDVRLGDWLTACPATPGDRVGHAAVCDDGVGVLAMSGHGSRPWLMDWEGVLLRRTGGGGRLAASALSDGSVDARSFGVRVGDRLRILTAPRVGGACEDDVFCRFERKITAVTASDEGVVTLAFQPPVNPDCFPEEGRSVRYEVRAGDSFLVTPGTGAAARLALGETYGPGRTQGRTARVTFTVRGDVPNTPDVTACDRYDEAGTAQGAQSELLSRDQPFGFVLDDAFTPWTHGAGFTSTGVAAGTAGQLPSDLILVPASGDIPLRAFVSYTVSNSVLGFEPSRGQDRYTGSAYRLFQ